LFSTFPELRNIILPYCYDLIGLSSVVDPDYFLILNNKISVQELPLWRYRFFDSWLNPFAEAYPNLEERFDTLIQCVSSDVLVKVFPHRAHEIYTRTPPMKLQDLARYINAVPEYADRIIQRHQAIIQKALQEKTIIYQLDCLWDLLTHATSNKNQLNELLTSLINSLIASKDIYQISCYLACTPPNIETVIERLV
jgi:hypothetical protein